MNLLFWKKKKQSQHEIEVISWNLIVAATDPDRCWKLASAFRETGIPGNVLTCETSFLMGSIVRDAIRSTITDSRQTAGIATAESAYFKTFDEQSKEELPEGMKAVYGNVRIGHVARVALAAYGKLGDSLFLTASEFVHRIDGDPRMKFEVMPIFEEERRAMVHALRP